MEPHCLSGLARHSDRHGAREALLWIHGDVQESATEIPISEATEVGEPLAEFCTKRMTGF
jgi:hypothetical protein